MIREAKRKDLEYKRFATADLAKYFSTFPSINHFEEVKEIVDEGLTELNDDEDNDLQMKPMYMNSFGILTIVDFSSGQICIHSHQLRSNLKLTHRKLTMPSGSSIYSTPKSQLRQSGQRVLLSVNPLKTSSVNASSLQN